MTQQHAVLADRVLLSQPPKVAHGLHTQRRQLFQVSRRNQVHLAFFWVLDNHFHISNQRRGVALAVPFGRTQTAELGAPVGSKNALQTQHGFSGFSGFSRIESCR